MAKEWLITSREELNQCFQEIFYVLKKTHKVKVQASSIRSKTKNQLGYYWGVILPTLTDFINETGQCSIKVSKSDVNEIMNRKFFYEEVIVGNEIYKVVKSKSGATEEQMRQFIDNVIDYCTNLGVFIPPPTDNGSIYD